MSEQVLEEQLAKQATEITSVAWVRKSIEYTGDLDDVAFVHIDGLPYALIFGTQDKSVLLLQRKDKQWLAKFSAVPGSLNCWLVRKY